MCFEFRALHYWGYAFKSADLEFEQNLGSVNSTEGIRGLIDGNSRYTESFEKCVEPCINLIEKTFSELKLKDKNFEIDQAASNDEIDELFHSILLDKDLKPKDVNADLNDRPALKAFLDHCTKQRTYFFSIKKCGKEDCTTCKPVRLPPDVFQQLFHLPDPTPSIENEGHYKCFNDCYGMDTSEEYRPSFNVNANKGHQIPFNPVKQHVLNTRLTLECSECSKPRLIYSKNKLAHADIKMFSNIMNDLLFTCGASLSEFPVFGDSKKHLMEKLYVRQNLNCQTPVETLYYSADIYPQCCCHCGSKRRLRLQDGHYPICSPCVAQKKQPIHKRKRIMNKKLAK